MKILDPGHCYSLNSLDGECEQTLTFVKREGPGYPGNVGSHPGTIMQEVLRALIERCEYVQRQVPCAETEAAANLLRAALWLFEARAARRHGRTLDLPLSAVVSGEGKCKTCGHVGCAGHVQLTRKAESPEPLPPSPASSCPSCGGTDAREVYSGRQKGSYCVGCGETRWEVPT